jgi:aminoglycoside phosphotransferase (APT) family kinase protein
MSDAGTIPGAGEVAELDSEATKATVRALERAHGPAVQILSLRRTPCEFATLFPAEKITAELSDGTRASLFVKLMGDEQDDHPDKKQRDRERLVYERLIDTAGPSQLPVPRYFGTYGNARTGRQQMFLEFVNDWTLKYHDLGHWLTAARQLAHLHAHFAARTDELRQANFLLTLNEVYFQGWLNRACVALASQSPALAARVDALTPRYSHVAQLLASQPATLVHNDLAPKNIIADRSMQPARICIIDWELAGVGCGWLDLVHLKYGLEEADEHRLVSAYCSELGESQLLPRDATEFARILAASKLHKTLYRLAHSAAWKLPLDQLTQWVTEAEKFLQRVLAT